MTREQFQKILFALLVAKAEFRRQLEQISSESPATHRQVDAVDAALLALDEATDIAKGFRFADLESDPKPLAAAWERTAK